MPVSGIRKPRAALVRQGFTRNSVNLRDYARCWTWGQERLNHVEQHSIRPPAPTDISTLAR